VDRLGEVLEVSGLSYALLQCNLGNLPHEAALRSLRLFSDEVMSNVGAVEKVPA
jgi:hypothetical protein